MYWRSTAALLLTSATLFDAAKAKLVTITEHVGACSAVYTSASRSVTVVVSTITVTPAPVPWTDKDANSGTPFVLEIEQPSTGHTRRDPARPPVWVTPDGRVTTVGSEAAQYVIHNGMLSNGEGGYVSTYEGVANQLFAIRTDYRDINTNFIVSGGFLKWTNPDFGEGVARFFQTPYTQPDNEEVLAQFSGPILPSWSLVALVARPVDEVSQGGSSGPMSSLSISTAINVGTMSLGPPMSSGGGSGGPPDYYSASAPISHAGQVPSTQVSKPSASPSANANTSPEGICGGLSGYTCTGSEFGDCCSQYGYCGTDDTYCGAGCQSAFGTCDHVRSASMSGMQSTSPNAPGGSILPQPSSPGGSGGSGVTSHRMSISASTTVPTSTFTSQAGPIGPNHPGVYPTGSSPMPVNMSSTYLLPSPQPTMSGSNKRESSIASSTSTSMAMASSSTPVSMAGGSSTNVPAMSSTSSSATPTTTVPVSPNGHCGTQGNGGTSQGYTCSGSVFGMCCSSSGFCGNSTDYCLGGCQSQFGSCTAQGDHPVTSMGECGVNWGNQTCTGGIFGPCCSTSGYCGNTDQYCAPGMCNPMFGVCNGASSSSTQRSSTTASSAMSSTVRSSSTSTPPNVITSSSTSSSRSLAASSSVPAMMTSSSSMPLSTRPTTTIPSSSSATSSSSTSSMASSSTRITSPSAVSSNTPSNYNPICPAANGTGFTDTAGTQYVIVCSFNTSPGAYASSTEPDFASCINACNTRTDQPCVAVTYSGQGCYFKSQYSGDSAGGSVNAAVLASVLGVTPAPYTVPGSTSTSLSTSTSTNSRMSSSITSSSTATSAHSNPVTTSITSSSAATTSPSTNSSTPATSTGLYLVLTSPTPCDFGDPAGYDEDDSYCEINLPFTMQMYAQTDTNSYACTNGFISIQGGSSQYEAQPLPASNLPNNAVAPFFDDLYLYGDSDPQQGIFYQFNAGQTAITYEYYLSRAGQSGNPFHFTVLYDSARVGVFTFTYYSVGGSSDEGLFAAVGIQGIDSTGTEQGFTYSYQAQDIVRGLVVECNTQANTCTTVSHPTKLLR